MKNIKRKLRAPIEVMRLITEYCPEYFLFFVPQVVFSSVLPLLFVYAPKLIIETLTDGRPYLDIIKIIVAFCGIALILNLLVVYISKKSSYCIQKFSNKLSAEIGRIVMNLSLSEIESASDRDNIRLAGNAEETIKICEIIKNFLQSAITLLGYIVIISKLNFKFFAIVIVLLSIKIAFTRISYKENIKLRKLTAQNDRTGDYLTTLCYFNQGAAKEVRVNSIRLWFLQKVRNFRRHMLKFQYKEFKRTMIFDSINTLLIALSSLYILWSLSIYYLECTISIADFTLYFTTITAIIAILGTITDFLAQYNLQLQSVADFGKLKDMSEHNSNNSPLDTSSHYIIPSSFEIVFSDIWFAYPGSENYVLRGVNIKITDREKLVVVGYNGAGKSTFIKLLCKFYRPTKGKIYLNGRDIWDIPNEQYHYFIGAVFQDFITLAFTISENISMCERVCNLSEVIQKVGLSDFLSSLPNCENTFVSKIFSSDGIELSGGQGQKIALARALYKNAPILILDEPTASLDVNAESELYANFMETVSDKMAIFISHRLAASHIADHIAVFSDGQLIEYGTHKELIMRNGLYAEMFEKQSKPYTLD